MRKAIQILACLAVLIRTCQIATGFRSPDKAPKVKAIKTPMADASVGVNNPKINPPTTSIGMSSGMAASFKATPNALTSKGCKIE